jgi:hypothetical protein
VPQPDRGGFYPVRGFILRGEMGGCFASYNYNDM